MQKLERTNNHQIRYNIITGEINHNLDKHRSYSSTNPIRITNQTNSHFNKVSILGISKDHNSFKYHYENMTKNPGISLPQISISQQQKLTMNYVSTPYNFINHGSQLPNSTLIDKQLFQDKLKAANRRNPLTKIIHQGRLLNPNYHQDYEKRVNNNQFYRKKQLCGSLCQTEKKYGVMKFFRKYK